MGGRCARIVSHFARLYVQLIARVNTRVNVLQVSNKYCGAESEDLTVNEVRHEIDTKKTEIKPI